MLVVAAEGGVIAMPSLTIIVHWLDAHALSIALALATLTGVLRAAYALAARILAPYPRARAFVEAVAAMAPDVLRFVQQLYRVLTGRDLPSTQPVSVMPSAPADETTVAMTEARQRARLADSLAAKQSALDVSATRGLTSAADAYELDHPAPSVAPDPADEDAHASIVPPAPSTPTPAHGVAHIAQAFAPVFDPSERQTIAPEVVARVSREGERGSVDVGTLVYAGSMLAFVLAMGLGILGCPAVREAALRVTPGVPDPLDCEPLAQRCDHGVPVVCSPVPVPGTNRHREWPSLPRAGNGSQRACAHGCTVDADGGAAHCIDADASADGGAL